MTVRVIASGCAECGVEEGQPLIDSVVFESIEKAKAEFETQGWLTGGGRWPVRWKSHPQGGEHVVTSQGSVWILPEKIKEIQNG